MIWYALCWVWFHMGNGHDGSMNRYGKQGPFNSGRPMDCDSTLAPVGVADLAHPRNIEVSRDVYPFSMKQVRNASNSWVLWLLQPFCRA